MKNELVSFMGNKLSNVVGPAMKRFWEQGIRANLSIPDKLGNIIKITTYKNHNIDIHLFMNK